MAGREDVDFVIVSACEEARELCEGKRREGKPWQSLCYARDGTKERYDDGHTKIATIRDGDG